MDVDYGSCAAIGAHGSNICGLQLGNLFQPHTRKYRDQSGPWQGRFRTVPRRLYLPRQGIEYGRQFSDLEGYPVGLLTDLTSLSLKGIIARESTTILGGPEYTSQCGAVGIDGPICL